ncbi:MAG: BMP family ABC transporter substrate-binding protein [Promicromonosporaceae bacterium]|nr:BMP family ABC transporter substrate-binding protein [Promicromonosporaceae bacterium]
MKRAIKLIAAAGAVALVLSACGDDNGGGAADVLPCVVSDFGGFDDRSFNQSALEGVLAAAEELGTDEPRRVQSAPGSDFAENLSAMVEAGCTHVVAVGFQMASAAWQVATDNPDVYFLIIDHDGAAGPEGEGPPSNLRPILFNTAEAGFLAGYLSAGFSETGLVGTYGGMPFPTVTIFMDGFRQGVEHHNGLHGTNVQVIGCPSAGCEDGLFTGGFAANPEAAAVATNVVDQGVDVLLPVGGPIYQAGLAAISASGRDIVLIGVDADLFYTDESTRDVLLTSILKNIAEATRATIVDAADGSWDPTPYIGTLENGGVGIAPFHNLTDRVGADLAGRVDEMRQGIIDGSITVTSYLD